MRKIFYFCGVIFCFCGCFNFPQSPKFATRSDFQEQFPVRTIEELEINKVLQIADAQKIALQNNPEYKSLFYAVSAAKNRYEQSLSGYLPQVNLSGELEHRLEGGYDLKNPPADVYRRKNSLVTGATLQASYLIFNGFEREISLLLAKNEYRQEEKITEDMQRILLRMVSFCYYDAILAQEEIRIAQADFDFQVSSLIQAENRYKSGFVSKAAVLNFKILANDAKSAILNASYRYEVAVFALLNLMGFDLSELPELELTQLEFCKKYELLNLETYLDMAIENRPDLQRVVLELETARLRRYKSYSKFFPEVYFDIGLDFEHETARFRHHNFRKSHYDDLQFFYGVRGNWNIFNGFRDYLKIREMSSWEKFYLMQLEKSYLKIITEVKDAYVNYRNSCMQADLYRESMQWVIEQRELVQAEYWGGQATINRLNGAQSQVVEAEGRLAIALINIEKARIQLLSVINDYDLN